MTRRIGGLIAGGLMAGGLMMAGCGSTYRAACQTTYNDCTNACGDTCSSPRAQEAGSEPERVNTYGPRCKACVDLCVAQANRCQARESEAVEPEEPIGDAPPE